MTDEILETDIDLARELLNKGVTDEEVTALLVRRGIMSMRAQKLVRDLREGKSPQADRPFQATFSPVRPAPVATETRQDRSQSSRSFSRKEKVGSKSRYFFPGLVLAMLVVAAGVIYLNRKSHPPAPANSSSPATAGDLSASSKTGDAVLFEVLEDGLHLSGVKTTSRDALTKLVALLGPAPRTNHLSDVNRTLYTYDSQGILVYSVASGAVESILLDFSAIGGNTGAKTAFGGTFKVGQREINAQTPAADLTQIKELGLAKTSQETGVFGGNYNDLHLLFSYFSGTDHLSIVEIDLK